MRFKSLVPILFLLAASAGASAEVADNFTTTTASLTGGGADDWFVLIRFGEEHIVFFETDTVPRGKVIDLNVSIIKNDFSDQWYGSATLPASAATFGPNLTYATVKATLLLHDRSGATKPFTVNVRVDGAGDVGSGRGICNYQASTETYSDKSHNGWSTRSRDNVLTYGSLNDGTTEYLSSWTPTYPNLLEEGKTLYLNPGQQ